MNDQEFALGIMQQEKSKPVDPGKLQMLGKQAAARYGEGVPLNQAVVQTIKTAQLAPEQIKRVCEFANTAAYLSAFEKSGEVRNVTFDGGPADPSAVIKDMNDGSAPAVHQSGDDDYAPPESFSKTAGAGDDSLLAEAFGHHGMFKAAEANQMIRADGVDELYDLKTNMDDMEGHFVSKLSSSHNMLKSAEATVIHTANQVLRDGGSLADVAAAWGGVSNDARMMKRAMSMVVDQLETGGWDQKDIITSMEKRAGGAAVNPKHQLCRSFIAFEKVATGHARLEEAVKVTRERRIPVTEKLAEALR